MTKFYSLDEAEEFFAARMNGEDPSAPELQEQRQRLVGLIKTRSIMDEKRKISAGYSFSLRELLTSLKELEVSDPWGSKDIIKEWIQDWWRNQ